MVLTWNMSTLDTIVKDYDKTIVLRDCQRHAFEYLRDNRGDLLFSLPVGYGKSLVYHLLPKVLGKGKETTWPLVWQFYLWILFKRIKLKPWKIMVSVPVDWIFCPGGKRLQMVILLPSGRSMSKEWRRGTFQLFCVIQRPSLIHKQDIKYCPISSLPRK